MDSVQVVRKVKKNYQTSNPLFIARKRGIIILHEYLGKSTWGYFSNLNRIPIIHLHNGLIEPDLTFTAAHELGHYFLHPNVNTPYLRRNTLQSVDRIEREANQFAVELLIPDELLLEGMTIYEAAAFCGVPEEIAHLKRKPDK